MEKNNTYKTGCANHMEKIVNCPRQELWNNRTNMYEEHKWRITLTAEDFKL